ncbi:hypothetical protein BC941DRAFT_465487 [Chlamydoabsidia padenii]|nr:hypothetical protein BC941DRAFT_465487 [Chlamydoabsidia padenii]
MTLTTHIPLQPSLSAIPLTHSDLQHWADPQLTHFMDRVTSRSASSSQSNGTSPKTPYDCNLLEGNQYEETLSGLFSHTEMSAINHKSSLKNLSMCMSPSVMISTTFDEHNLHMSPKNRTMPETTTGEDYNTGGDSIRRHQNGSGDDDMTFTLGQQKEYDDTCSMNSGSLYSIDYEDFPNPPSSTPSIMRRLSIQTRQHNLVSDELINTIPFNDHRNKSNPDSDCTTTPLIHHGCNLFVSRFKEVFDLDALDYANYQQQQHKIPQHDELGNNEKHGNRLGDLIASIGRPSQTKSKITLSSSPSRQSLRGLIRNISTATGNRCRHIKKIPDDDDNSLDDDNETMNSYSSSFHEEPRTNQEPIMTADPDERRRNNMASLLYDVIRRSPTHHRQKNKQQQDNHGVLTNRRPTISTRRTDDFFDKKQSFVPSLTRSTTLSSPKSSVSSLSTSSSTLIRPRKQSYGPMIKWGDDGRSFCSDSQHMAEIRQRDYHHVEEQQQIDFIESDYYIKKQLPLLPCSINNKVDH